MNHKTTSDTAIDTTPNKSSNAHSNTVKPKPSLRLRLVGYTLVVCLLAIMIHAGGVMGVTTNTLSERTLADFNRGAEVANLSLKAHLQSMEDLVRRLERYEQLRRFMDGEDVPTAALDEVFAHCTELTFFGNKTTGGDYFFEYVGLYNKKGRKAAETIEGAFQRRQNLSDKLYAQFREGVETVQWYEAEDALWVCVYVREHSDNAVLVGMIPKSALAGLYAVMEGAPAHQWSLADAQGRVLLCSDEDRSQAQRLHEYGVFDSSLIEMDRVFYYVSGQPAEMGLASMIAMPRSAVFKALEPTISVFVLTLIAILPFVVMEICAIVWRITHPLYTVTKHLQKVGEGQFETKMPPFSTRELDAVSRVFNHMTEYIHQLITQDYENKLLVQAAQLRYLQSQTNPHFIFNVLSVVGMKALMCGDRDIYDMIHALSTLLQGKIFKNNSIYIRLSEEMELVRFFLFLEEKRFPDKISYSISVEDSSLLNVQIPRLSIEPLVENALIHGLEPKADRGHISVVVSQAAEVLVIAIEDDGVGFDMDGQPVDTTPKGTTGKHTHMGIQNTRQLIHNLYGEAYGITITSAVNAGTAVEIRLPMNGAGNPQTKK